MGIRSRLTSALRGIFARQSPQRWFATVIPAWSSGSPAAWAENVDEQTTHYSHWVYAAVHAIASKIASTDLGIYMRVDSETPGALHDVREVSDPSHPLVRLMEEVNPFQTRFGLWESTVMFLELTGNAYWYVAENRMGVPAEIWLIPPQYMRVVPDSREFIRGYFCRCEGTEVMFDRREIVHLKYSNPRSPFYGRGPLQAAAASVDTHERLKKAEWSAFSHGLMSDLALETDQPLTPAMIDRLRAQLSQKYAGPENAGRPLVLEGGLKAKPISLSPREMAFLQSARMTRDEILGIFGVPAAVAGLSEDVNRAVAEAMDVIFTRYCIEPKLRLIEGQINQDLARRFDDRLFCRFRSAIPEDRAENRAEMEANLRLGVTTVNEERRKQGKLPVPWGDRPLLPSNYAPLA
jgi:HK97 family phage portal protein